MSINIPTDQIPLGELDVLIVDVQTSGATPPKAQVIELAWGFVRAHAWDEVSAPTQGLHAELIKLRSKRLPRRVEEITGIRTSMLRDAPDEVDVWGRLLGTLPNVEPTITVAHYARFETKFLHHLHETHTPQHPFPFDILCTHAIARRLFPNLPRYGLRALAGYLGHHTPAVKRALDHAAATAYVWSHLVEHLEEHDIHTLHDLHTFLSTPNPPRPTRRLYPIQRHERLALPHQPGVYQMRDIHGAVLYVGKATDLKHRVNSYFRGRSSSERHLELLTRTRALHTIPTASPLEAALLETDLIKDLSPPYNIALQTNDRAIGFVSPSLLVEDTHHTPTTPIGPLPSPRSLRSLRILTSTLDNLDRLDLTASQLAWILSTPSSHTPPLEMALKGLHIFLDAHPELVSTSTRSTRSMLLALGSSLWSEALRQREDVGPPPDDSPEEPSKKTAFRWTPQHVASAIESTLLHQTRLLRRADVLRMVASAHIVWRPLHHNPSNSVRWIAFQNARPVHRATLSDWPDPANLPHLLPAHLDSFSVADYDRLRVLTSELKRILRDGSQALVSPARSSTSLSPKALANLLRWV